MKKLIQATLLSWTFVAALALSAAQAAEGAAINLNDVPREYLQGSGEVVQFKTHGISDHAVLLYQAFNPATQPWTELEEFGGVTGAYRGGLRFIPPQAMAKLPAGVWLLRVYVHGDEATEAYAAITVMTPKPAEDEEFDRLLREADAEVVDEPVSDDPIDDLLGDSGGAMVIPRRR